jgi:hypothetical protein
MPMPPSPSWHVKPAKSAQSRATQVSPAQMELGAHTLPDCVQAV